MEKKVFGKIISSLEKVLPEKEPALKISCGSMFLNEEYNENVKNANQQNNQNEKS